MFSYFCCLDNNKWEMPRFVQSKYAKDYWLMHTDGQRSPKGKENTPLPHFIGETSSQTIPVIVLVTTFRLIVHLLLKEYWTHCISSLFIFINRVWGMGWVAHTFCLSGQSIEQTPQLIQVNLHYTIRRIKTISLGSADCFLLQSFNKKWLVQKYIFFVKYYTLVFHSSTFTNFSSLDQNTQALTFQITQ